jgi:hypothetical protein
MKNSFKVLLTTALLFTATLSTYAQFENNRETCRFHMGLRAGVSSNTYTGDALGAIDPLVYFTGGLAFDIQVAPVPVFVGWGLNYLNEGVKNYRGVDYNASAIHIPLVVGYHFNLSPNFFISPYVGGFSSYCVEDLDNKGWDNERFNYGLRFGVGLNFGRLTFDAAYDLGLKNIGNSMNKRHTSTLFFTLGVNLVGKR